MGKRTGKKKNATKIETKYLPTTFTLTVRALVGAYLLYTAYSLIDGVMNGEGRDKYFFGVFLIAFTVIGILLLLCAGRDLLRGRYVGGALDAGEAANEGSGEESTAGKRDAVGADAPDDCAERKTDAADPGMERDGDAQAPRS